MAVDRERIGLVAMEAMDELDYGDDAELQGVGVVVAVAHHGQSTVSSRFKDPAGNNLGVLASAEPTPDWIGNLHQSGLGWRFFSQGGGLAVHAPFS